MYFDTVAHIPIQNLDNTRSSVSRQNACDRCRGQKLRCVRQSDADNRPCDRCRKARAECINTLYSRRKDATEREEDYEHTTYKNRPDVVISLSGAGHPSNGYTRSRASTCGIIHASPISSAGAPSTTHGAAQLAQSQKRSLSHSVLERPSKRSCHASSSRHLGSTGLRDDVSQTAFSQDSITNDEGSRRNRSTPFFFARSGDNDNSITPDKGGTDSTFAASAFDLGMGLDPVVPSHQLNLPRKLPYSPLLTVSDCLQCLLELSSRLIKNVHDCKGSCKTLDDILAFKSSDSQPESSLKNAIGSLLESSQILLNVLYRLKDLNTAVAHTPGSDRCPANSECWYSELWEMNTSPPLLGTYHLSEASSSSSSSSFPDLTAPTPPFPQPPTETPPSSLDIPTMFTSLTCYIWLLYTYDTVFSSIEASLNGDMPGIIPGLTVGGFELDGHKDLQVEIFMQLSTKMLGRIEDALGIEVTTAISDTSTSLEGHRRLVDRNKATQALLDTVFWRKEGKVDVAARIWEKTTCIRNALQDARTMG